MGDHDLYMPNGITLTQDQKYLLMISGVQILKYSLEQKKLLSEPFVTVMPGTGDNIRTVNHLPSGKKTKRNCYWAALGSKFSQPFSLLKAISERPNIKTLLLTLVPYGTIINAIPKLSALAVYDENGEITEVYQDTTAVAPWLSEGEIMGDYLYLGSWYNSFLARVKLSELNRIK